MDDVIAQRLAGQTAVRALMIESHLRGGRQELGAGALAYGQSITDACLGFDETQRAIETAREPLCASAALARARATGSAPLRRNGYSGTVAPEPPISFGMSFILGSPSLMWRTVSP